MFLLSTNSRLRIFLFLILIISILLIIRVIFLSSVNVEDYNIVDTPDYNSIKRGEIVDRNGKILAVSDELESVYANPSEIKSKDNVSLFLSKALNINQKIIFEKINTKKNFVWLKRQIVPAQAQIIEKANIEGVYLKKEYKRFYPNKNLSSQILGFCDIDSKGVEGIEKSFDNYLYPVKKLKLNNEEQSGLNISLTIDSNIQSIAEIALKKSIIAENADSGTLIFVDGKSGEILAMANYPDFDPNFYKDYSQKNFRNIAIFNQFEPGSVFKIFTIASLLDAGLINLDDYFMCTGAYHKNNLTVKDTGVHGLVNVAKIFKYSCNTGTIEAASRMNEKELYNYLKLFGFGETTSVMLPGEQIGLFRNVDQWSERSMLSIPIGQEVSVNSLQIIRAATTFVNDGIMIEPYIVNSIFDSNNKIVKKFTNKEIRRVIKSGISKEIIDSMKSATDELGGTARLLKIEGIDFSAKSGTAEIYDPVLKKYADNDVISSLITIFPQESPRYIAYAVFNKPRGKVKWGGIIGSKLLNDFISNLTGYIDFNSKESLKINNKNINNIIKDNYITKIPFTMPDLTGISGGDALNVFSKLNLKIKIIGNGKVIDQNPKPDEIVQINSSIEIYLKE